jgi:hypothetical protein
MKTNLKEKKLQWVEYIQSKQKIIIDCDWEA